MKYPCGLIRDVMPLYHDGVCSGDSQQAIKEHISQCEDCKKYLSELKECDNITVAEKNKEQEGVNMLKKIKDRLFRKKVIVSLISILCSVIIMIGVSIFVNNFTVPIELKNENIVVKSEDGFVYAYTNESVYRLNTQKVVSKHNGKTQNDLYFNLSSTLWNKCFYKKSDVQSKYLLPQNSPVERKSGIVGDVDHVYYYVGDLSKLESMSKEELEATTEGAALAWSKN